MGIPNKKSWLRMGNPAQQFMKNLKFAELFSIWTQNTRDVSTLSFEQRVNRLQRSVLRRAYQQEVVMMPSQVSPNWNLFQKFRDSTRLDFDKMLRLDANPDWLNAKIEEYEYYIYSRLEEDPYVSFTRKYFQDSNTYEGTMPNEILNADNFGFQFPKQIKQPVNGLNLPYMNEIPLDKMETVQDNDTIRQNTKNSINAREDNIQSDQRL